MDPEKGDKSNDGSAQHPWRTLEDVVDPANHLIAARANQIAGSGEMVSTFRNPGAPIHSGDVIYLMSGDHGSPIIRQIVNDGFIEVAAAPGQIPIIDSIRVIGSSRWLFDGLKFRGGPTGEKPAKALIDLVSDSFHGPSDNLIIVNSSASTEDDVKNWADEDWVKKPYPTGISSRARCVTLAHNHFFHLRDAMAIMGNDQLVQDNLIDEIGNDGIDVMASNITLRGNIIRDGHHTASEPLHADGIQGWNLNGAPNRNVTIDSNTIVKTSEGADDQKYMQGISIFDGKWDGLKVVNNVVATNTWHGIALYGVENAVVINNTVIPMSPNVHDSWIIIHKSKDNTPSTNVIVRNNISSQLIISGVNVTYDHNIAEKLISVDNNGAVVKYTHGVIGDANYVEPRIYISLARIDHPKGLFDLRPSADSRAFESGNPTLAPILDIAGDPRNGMMDIGAYAHDARRASEP